MLTHSPFLGSFIVLLHGELSEHFAHGHQVPTPSSAAHLRESVYLFSQVKSQPLPHGLHVGLCCSFRAGPRQTAQ